MVFQSSCNIMVITFHIYCTTSQNIYVFHWPLGILQWSIIGVPLLFVWNHILGNISEFSLILLDTRCVQPYPYFKSLLLSQLWTLTNQYLHQNVLPCTHPCMGSLYLPYLGSTLEISDCWLGFWFTSRFLLAKPFWPILLIWRLLQNSRVLEWNGTPIINNSPKLVNELFIFLQQP